MNLQIDKAGRLIDKDISNKDYYWECHRHLEDKFLTCGQINYTEDNKVLYYLLINGWGRNCKKYTEKELIEEIKNNHICVDNLLVRKNKLVETDNNIRKVIIKTSSIKRSIKEEKIINMLPKLKLLGQVQCIRTYDDMECYYMEKPDNNKVILYIPDDVTQLNNRDDLVFTIKFNELLRRHGDDIQWKNVEIIGGHNLLSAESMFELSCVKSIDLNLFDTSRVENMYRMFKGFCLKPFDKQPIDLFIEDAEHDEWDKIANILNIKTKEEFAKLPEIYKNDKRRIEEAYEQYIDSYNILDLSSFDTSNVMIYCDIFKECNAKKVIIDSFTLNSNAKTVDMFTNTRVEISENCDERIKQIYNEQKNM